MVWGDWRSWFTSRARQVRSRSIRAARNSSTSQRQVHFQEVRQKCAFPAEMSAYWKSWIEKYPIVSLEDGAEDDWSGWKTLTNRRRKKSRKDSTCGRRFVCDNTEAYLRGSTTESPNAIDQDEQIGACPGRVMRLN